MSEFKHNHGHLHERPVLSLEEMKALGQSALDDQSILTIWFWLRCGFIIICLITIGGLIIYYKDVLEMNYRINQPAALFDFIPYIGVRFAFVFILISFYIYGMVRQSLLKLTSFAVFFVAFFSWLNDLSALYFTPYHDIKHILYLYMSLRCMIVLFLFFNFWSIRRL
jgi:hypothetical protein